MVTIELLLCVASEAILACVVNRVSLQVACEYYGDPIHDEHVGSLFICLLRLCNFAVGTVIPRLTKTIRSGITFVSRNLRWPKRDFT